MLCYSQLDISPNCKISYEKVYIMTLLNEKINENWAWVFRYCTLNSLIKFYCVLVFKGKNLTKTQFNSEHMPSNNKTTPLYMSKKFYLDLMLLYCSIITLM